MLVVVVQYRPPCQPFPCAQQACDLRGTGDTEKDPSGEDAAPAKEAGDEVATMMGKMVGQRKDEEEKTPSETVVMTIEMTGLEEDGEGEARGGGEKEHGREEVVSAGQTPLIASTPETAVSSGSSAAVAAALASAPTPTPAPVPAPAGPANQSVPEHEPGPLPGLLAEEGVTKTKHLNVVAVSHAAAVGK